MSALEAYSLDTETLNLFALKGREAESPDPFNANAAPVRRVMQIVCDLAGKPFSELSLLDLACGEGVYAIESALRGARVLALDGRTERMNKGKDAAERLALSNLRFEQHDIRRVNVETYGQFDVVYFLGILYHLDDPDVFSTLENVFGICRDFVIIDTHFSLEPQDMATYKTENYHGRKWREHRDSDPEELRRANLLASLDNTFSFWLTKESLITLLRNIGFTTVFECYSPSDATKPQNRATFVAMKGQRINLSTYPWINEKTDEEIRKILRPNVTSTRGPGAIRKLPEVVNGLLSKLGYEIRRL